MHWHTLHPTPKPLRAWGVQRGDCERVRPCIAPRSRPSAAPFLADGQDAVVADGLLFKSRAERSRPWFAGAHFVSGLRVLVPVVRTRRFDARRSALARSRIAARLQNADMYCAASLADQIVYHPRASWLVEFGIHEDRHFGLPTPLTSHIWCCHCSYRRGLRR